MVNKFLMNLVFEYGARVGKSVFNAYNRVVNSKSINLDVTFIQAVELSNQVLVRQPSRLLVALSKNP